MATESNGPKSNYHKERERLENPDDWAISEVDAELVLEFLDALDPDNYDVQPGGIGTKSYSTLDAYAQNLRLTAKAAGDELRALSEAQINSVFTEMAQDLNQNTVQQRQASARVFYRYHDQLGVDPELITIVENKPSAVDPRDLFTREELAAMRDATDNARDRALIDMAVYTGQRIRALQTLRVGDVNPEEGRFYLNPEAFGLKGAKGMRSLLIAKESVAEWLDYHPAPDTDDAYLFSKLPDAANGGITDPLHQTTINRAIRRAAERAGIDRTDERAHAHNLRHTFVRWAYVVREMDLATIKWMMGHAPDSRTLEETYFNILDVDHAQKAEEAAGLEDPEENAEDLAPEACPFCDYTLPPEPKACPRCGNVLTADAQDVQQEVQQDVGAAKALSALEESSDLSEEQIEAIAAHDSIMAKLIELRSQD